MTKIHPFQNARSTSWPGGKTTELFIFPRDADYANRDFGFRISTATIEVETSDFTALPNYNRLLAVLEGGLELIYEGKYGKKLAIFESDRFHGSWKTQSRGKARDFNVIYTDQYKLGFKFVTLKENTAIKKSGDFLFLFALNEMNGYHRYDLIEVSDTAELEKGFCFFQVALDAV